MNKCIRFHPDHPLYESHHQQLRSRHQVPVPKKIAPKPPPKKPSVPDKQWKKEARHFSAYILILYRPWYLNEGTLPGTLSWNELCRHMKDLEFGTDGIGPSFLATFRRKLIEKISQGLRFDSKTRTINQMHRCRAATTWGHPDHTEPMLPSMDPIEEDPAVVLEATAIIGSLRKQQAMDDEQSRRDAKQQIALRHTLDAIKRVTIPLRDKPIGQRMGVIQASDVVHVNQPPGTLSIPKLIESLVEDLEDEETIDGDPGILLDGMPSTPLQTPEELASGLNKRQRLVFDSFLTYFANLASFRQVFQNKRSCKWSYTIYYNLFSFQGAKSKPVPYRIFAHGGPGVGKTHMAKAIRNLAVYFGFTVTCMAPTGIAASNLPNGRTIHNACGINPQKDINKFEAPLSNNRKLFHQKRLKKETIALVVIDEVSAIPPHQFGQIEWRLRDIMSNGSLENTESPSDGLYGGLAVLLMVHFFLLIIFLRNVS